MVKLLLGLLKGLVIGVGVGYGAFAINLGGPGLNYVVYGTIGALVGLLVGRPIWSNILDKNATSWVSILKAVFGFGVGCGVYALVAEVIEPDFLVRMSFLSDQPRQFVDWQPLFGGILGGLYGAFVELDDSVDDTKSPKKLPAAKKPDPKK